MAVRRPGINYKPYFQNRVSEVQRNLMALEEKVQVLEPLQKVPGTLNPADIATRVHTPAQLKTSSWFDGPEFLRQGIEPPTPQNLPDKLPEEQSQIKALVIKEREPPTLVVMASKFSSWSKIIRITEYVIAAITKFKRLSADPKLIRAQGITLLLKQLQRESFSDARALLRTSNQLPGNHRLAPLSPWMDDQGIMRVGSRLRKSRFPFNEIYPILLPDRHPITLAILAHYHAATCHQGRTITTARLTQAGFRILNSRRTIASFLRQCVMCRRLRGELMKQQMGELPADRLEKTAPFERSGMDVFGPYWIQSARATRATKATKKVWVMLLTCLYSRAVHLEVLTGLDTVTFLLAYRRFTASRGPCYFLRSDHGSNFMGAKNQEDVDLNLQEISTELKERDCTWELNPPFGSHMAGVWERKVGSVKKVLTAALQMYTHHNLSGDEFSTLVKEAEAIVNSTPLAEIESSPDEPYPVSPAMLLNQREFPVSNQTFTEKDLMAYGKRRWRRVQVLADVFWDMWKKQYISELHLRTKWLRPTRNVMVGDVVIIKEASPRPSWPIGIVHETLPGADGLVRKAIIRLASKRGSQHRYKERSIHDLVLLIPRKENEKRDPEGVVSEGNGSEAQAALPKWPSVRHEPKSSQ